MLFLKIFAVGWGILTGAIFLNLAANKLGIIGWYEFLNNVGKVGFTKAFESAGPASIIFLFILYPFLLGLISYLIFRLFS